MFARYDSVRYAASVAALMLVSTAPTVANDFQPVGGRMGSIFLYATGEVSATYTDNAYLENSGEKSGFYTRITPGLELRSDWNRHAFGARIAGNFGIYHFNDGDDNYKNALAEVSGKLDVRRGIYFSLDRLAYERVSEQRGGDDISVTNAEVPWNAHRFGVEGSFVYRPYRVLLEVSGSFDRLIYDDLDEIGGTVIDGDFRSHKNYGGAARAGVAFSREHYIYVRGTLGKTVYDEAINLGGFDRDSDTWSVFGGLELYISELLQIDVSGGYVSTSYDDPTLDKVDGVGARGTISWSPDRRTSVAFQLRTDVKETINTGASGRLHRSATLAIKRSIARNIVWDADATLVRQTYDGGPVDRRDTDFNIGTGLKYFANRHVFFGLAYDYQMRNSDAIDRDYRANSVSLTIGTKL